MKTVMESLTFETAIDVREPARHSLISLLNQRLADMIDLFNQTKHAHWNAKGPQFIQVHELFDQIAERVEEHCDLLSERAVMLGGVAEGTTRQSAANSSIGEYDLSAVDGLEHVRALARQVAKVAAAVRGAIRHSADLDDPTTTDLFTEISRALDKDLWFLEAHLQAKS
jgi:starvation-inducible DNA-binding protein